ncbi:MAG: winged helix-turn-helix transcriptional regulator [Deltaproteobacteria bacterium]|nr:winged helix-turn-helix transcriptional regulator [Deltaproteobacteria bacterium]
MLLEEILGTRNQIRVLRVLFRRFGAGVSEVAREAGLRPSAALFALRRLVDTGLVRMEVRGRYPVYSINPAHFLAGPIERLLAAEAGAGPHLVAVVRTLVGEENASGLQGVCVSPDGRVYVCHVRPEAVDARRLAQVLDSMFGLRVASVVPDPAGIQNPYMFIPAERGAGSVPSTADRHDPESGPASA